MVDYQQVVIEENEELKNRMSGLKAKKKELENKLNTLERENVNLQNQTRNLENKVMEMNTINSNTPRLYTADNLSNAKPAVQQRHPGD